MNLSDFQNHEHLWFRLCWAASVLPKVQSKYRVVFEDPDDLEAPAKVLVPDPNWMAAALHGGVLPDISSYIADQRVLEAYEQEHGSQEGFDWRDYDPQHPYTAPRGPMTEEDAIEYLIQKDIPARVWRDYKGNRTILRIVNVEKVPENRTLRNAWQVQQTGASQGENQKEYAA